MSSFYTQIEVPTETFDELVNQSDETAVSSSSRNWKCQLEIDFFRVEIEIDTVRVSFRVCGCVVCRVVRSVVGCVCDNTLTVPKTMCVFVTIP